MILETVLIAAALPFVGLSLYFGTKGGYYDSDNYTGDGCAHDVKRWTHFLKFFIQNGLDLHQL